MRIFFVHTGNETFVKLDRELLEVSFEVHDFHARQKFPYQLKEYLDGIRKSDLLYCWFASWNSFWALLFARLYHKPSILVIGGYDLANLPDAGYGHQRGGIGKWVSRAAMRMAEVLLTNSVYSQKEAESNARIRTGEVCVIYHGVPDLFGELPNKPKERMALTVGNVEWPNLKRKGLETFVRAASYLPDVKFVLAGAWKDDAVQYLRSIASTNVLFTGWLSDEELVGYYRRSSVYVQASLHEGFGLSLAEAMLAGCVPVVTRAGALPEVAGDCGFYCETPTPEAVETEVSTALQAPEGIRKQARERILSEFPLKKRGIALAQMIRDCVPVQNG